MHGGRGKRGQAHRDVFGSVLIRRAVANPLSRGDDDGLSGPHLPHAVRGFDPQSAAEHDRDLLEVMPYSIGGGKGTGSLSSAPAGSPSTW